MYVVAGTLPRIHPYVGVIRVLFRRLLYSVAVFIPQSPGVFTLHCINTHLQMASLRVWYRRERSRIKGKSTTKLTIQMDPGWWTQSVWTERRYVVQHDPLKGS